MVSLCLSCDAGECFTVEDLELQRQVVYSLNSVLYEQLQYEGNEFDYYNPLNSYIHQVVNASFRHDYDGFFFPPKSCLKLVTSFSFETYERFPVSESRCYNAARAFPLASPSST